MKEWKIDTGITNEVEASKMRATLEASRDHHLATQTEAAGLPAAAAAGEWANPKDLSGAMAHAKKIEEAAAPLKAAFAAKAAALADDMQLGIDTACAIVDHLAAKSPGRKTFFTASICGHSDPRHPSASAERLSVSVDQTWKD